MENLELWNKRARVDINCNSVIAPDDITGLKKEYVDIVNKAAIAPIICSLNSGSNILDFGCGVGRISNWKEFNNLNYYGIDSSPEMIEVAIRRNIKENIHFSLVQEYPALFENSFFDCVISIWVLQHVLDDNMLLQTINEIYRVLKPGGFLIIIEQVAPFVKYEYLNNGEIYKKCRTIDVFNECLNPKFDYISSHKTKGFIRNGICYKLLNVFSFLKLKYFLRFIPWMVDVDEFIYGNIIPNYLRRKPAWIDTQLVYKRK